MNKIKELLFRAKLNLVNGADIKIVNGGNSVDEVVIQHKDLYIMLLLDCKTGDPVSYCWSRDSGMTHVPVREWYKTTREERSN